MIYVKFLPNKLTSCTHQNLRAPWRWSRTEAETCRSHN